MELDYIMEQIKGLEKLGYFLCNEINFNQLDKIETTTACEAIRDRIEAMCAKDREALLHQIARNAGRDPSSEVLCPYLLEHVPEFQSDRTRLFYHAVQNNNAFLKDLAIEGLGDIPQEALNTALTHAACSGSKEMIQGIMDMGADIQAVGSIVLKVAFELGNFDVIEYLQTVGLTSLGDTGELLQVTAGYGNSDAVLYLLEHCDYTEAAKDEALACAVTYYHPDTVLVLLIHGAKMDAWIAQSVLDDMRMGTPPYVFMDSYSVQRTGEYREQFLEQYHRDIRYSLYQWVCDNNYGYGSDIDMALKAAGFKVQKNTFEFLRERVPAYVEFRDYAKDGLIVYEESAPVYSNCPFCYSGDIKLEDNGALYCKYCGGQVRDSTLLEYQ